MDRIYCKAMLQVLAPHMLAGRYDRAITPQDEKLRILLAIILPHCRGVQATASARVVVGQASGAKLPVTGFDSGSPEGFAPADAGSRIGVRIEDRWGGRQQLRFHSDI